MLTNLLTSRYFFTCIIIFYFFIHLTVHPPYDCYLVKICSFIQHSNNLFVIIFYSWSLTFWEDGDNLKAIDLSSLPIGKVLARDIYDAEGRLLLPKNVMLKPSHLQHLLNLNHKTIYVIENDHNNQPRTQDFKYEQEETLLPVVFVSAVETIRNLMCQIIDGHIIKRSEVEDTMDLIVPEIIHTNNVWHCLNKIRVQDDYTFQHSVSVCVIAVKIGQAIDMPEGQLRQLGIAALLHDVGKAKIPTEIIKKPGPLNPVEIREMRKHPLYGSQIVNDLSFPDRDIVTAVLQHHEYADGRGYPLQLSAENIHPYSRIIAVADVFDAITSERYYRPRFALLNAIEEITRETCGHLDPIITRRLIRYILNIVPGEKVQLNTGERARVILANEKEPMRPLIQTADRFIDLSEERELSIENRL